MNQELRALQVTRYGKGDEERRSDVGGGKDEPTEWKCGDEEPSLRSHARASICRGCRYSQSDMLDIQRYSAFTSVCGYFSLSCALCARGTVTLKRGVDGLTNISTSSRL